MSTPQSTKVGRTGITYEPANGRRIIRCACKVCKGQGAEVGAAQNCTTATLIHNYVQIAQNPVLRGTFVPVPA